jgi:hypothetical protein
MIRAKSIGSNMIEVRHGDNLFLISYNTPVAAFVKGEFYRTTTKFSRTTSKHINKWLDGAFAREVSQGVIEAWIGWNA